MIAGNPSTDADEITHAIRKVCPDIGLAKRNGKIILIGNNIKHLKRRLEILSRIEAVEPVNKYGTAAILEIKSSEAGIIGMMDKRRGEELCVIA